MELKEIVEKYRIKTVLSCFSGGKDSLVATHYAYEHIPANVQFEVLHVNTTVALPGVQEYVKKVCDEFGWRLVILRPFEDFFTLAERRGMPSRRRRWCCYKLKVEPLIRYTMRKPMPRMQITGLRAYESHRRKNKALRGEIKELMWRNIGMHYIFSPIFWWKDHQIHEYIKEHGLPVSPIYNEFGFSGECICSLYTKVEDLIKISVKYPDFMRKFSALEDTFRNRGSAFYDYRRKRRIYARSLIAMNGKSEDVREKIRKRMKELEKEEEDINCKINRAEALLKRLFAWKREVEKVSKPKKIKEIAKLLDIDIKTTFPFTSLSRQILSRYLEKRIEKAKHEINEYKHRLNCIRREKEDISMSKL
ncbi:MAG: phosphoadenosine phosphosulfate reductase family protein [Candidatus Methanospirare jalkutatii]|nr:phosphoadenosine phosphosulfate reductase family protein [Candidatus Methanospirare jalkutatii]